VNGLSGVASNDDENDLSGLGIITSKVSFTATAGTTYRIAVDGFNNDSEADPGAAESGSITLNLASTTPDTTAPDPPVITSPQDQETTSCLRCSYDRDGDITLSGTAEANSTVKIFEVIAPGTFSGKGTTPVDSSGTWSKTLTGVPDGSHTYGAKAIDEAGNVSRFSFRACTVIVDTIVPSVTNVVPAENATSIAPSQSVSAIFSEEMSGSILKAFKFYGQGSTDALEATVSFDAATKRATLDPHRTLRLGTKYKAIVTTGAKDWAGNRLDQNPSKEGSQKKEWYFTIKP
jgi:Big-like domain-containing protein